MTKSSQNKCQNCISFLKSTYPEMQTKHIHTVLEYQSLTSRHQLLIDIKNETDTVLVDIRY